MGEQAQGGFVSQEGFMLYYSDINAVLPAERETYFVELVLKTWGISPKIV